MATASSAVPTGMPTVTPLAACDVLFTDPSQIDWCNAVSNVIASSAAASASSTLNAATSAQLAYDMNQFFLIIMGALVMFMHAGFAMLSAGSVRSKNAQNILLCTVLDLCTCALAWYFTGYGFAFGADNGNGFIGTDQFVGFDVGPNGIHTFGHWWFEFTFAATSATIVAGAVAERANFKSYMLYSFVASAWVYPVIVHWVWGGGFLTMGNPQAVMGLGSLDFAGDGPVHMIGGVSAMICAKLIGPRIGRYDEDGKPVPIPGHNSALVNIGTFILWFGWFGFNPGSIINVAGGGSDVAGRCAVNTMLASAGATVSSLFFAYAYRAKVDGHRVFDFGVAMNGALAGLVGITGPCAGVEMWAAICIGVVAGVVYVLASDVVLYVLKIDDPLDAVAVHFFCGVWGLLAGGIFANPAMISVLSAGLSNGRGGFIYPGAGGDLILCQLVEIACILGFVGGCMTPIFVGLHSVGALRISAPEEEEGLDSSVHGGSAQPELYKSAFYNAKMATADA